MEGAGNRVRTVSVLTHHNFYHHRCGTTTQGIPFTCVIRRFIVAKRAMKTMNLCILEFKSCPEHKHNVLACFYFSQASSPKTLERFKDV